eukprot:TRINITY_DN346_c0_g1_i1.p1 TRINITY_DN346_c0_g1~~TRINITY_DN346_c0_g1_i1.p1  ORF type:complete len:1398 (+),score=311.69 TRINITY_DN346_c0_g1_i1:86-4279(+)
MGDIRTPIAGLSIPPLFSPGQRETFLDRGARGPPSSSPRNANSEQRARKDVWQPSLLALFFAAAAWRTVGVTHFGAYWVASTCGLLLAAVGVIFPPVTRRLPLRLAECIVAGGAFCALLGDWHTAAAMGVRTWPLVIALVNLLRAVRASVLVGHAVLCVTVGWLVLSSIEDSYRLGVYDAARWDGDQVADAELTECAAPPCEKGLQGLGACIFYATCLFVNWLAVRRTHHDLRQAEDRLLQGTVRIAQQVLTLLGEYSTSEAELVIAECGDQLPPELRSALEFLTNNLMRYRPFLPDVVLDDKDCNIADEESLDSPSAGSSHHSPSLQRFQSAPKQLLPQLGAEETRSALQCIVAQARGAERAELLDFLTERVQLCVDVADSSSAGWLLGCGWDAPPALQAAFPSRGRRRGTEQQAPPPTVQQSGRRFADGTDRPDSATTTIALFPPGYTAPSALETTANLTKWHCPKGDTYWPSKTVYDMIADYETCHPRAREEDNTLALWIYTAEFHAPVTWAAWQSVHGGGSWDAVPPDVQLSDAPTDFDWEYLHERGVEIDSPNSWEVLGSSGSGLTVYGPGGRGRLVRFECSWAGDEELCPLRDTTAWAPRPDSLLDPDCLFGISDRSVPPGVLEYILSRGADEHLSRQSWESIPIDLPQLRSLMGACFAQKNQQRSVPRLCQEADIAFRVSPKELEGYSVDAQQVARAIRVAYRFKCPEGATAGLIANGCELGLLRWREEWILLALTGVHRGAVVIGPGDLCAEQLWVTSTAYVDQPYRLMNAAMREQQGGNLHAELRLVTHAGPDCLTARQPEDPPPEPAPARFASATSKLAAVWTGMGWAVSRGEMVDDGLLEVNAWTLPQCRALIWRVEAALQDLPRMPGLRMAISFIGADVGGGPGGRRASSCASPVSAGSWLHKGYRGLQGVSLCNRAYRRDRVVVFAAFSSTSFDQGIASQFVGSSGAIFTMYTSSGRMIAPWSRYSREQEVLLPPNTLHLVTDSLSADHAAILDKAELQLFDLQEITVAGAVAHLAKRGALRFRREHPSMLSQAERTGERAARGDWIGAAQELLRPPHASDYHERFDRPVLPRGAVGVIALLLNSSGGSMVGAAIDAALWSTFFEQAERKVRAHGGRILATHTGTLIAMTGASGALQLADALLGSHDTQRLPSTTRSPASPDGSPLPFATIDSVPVDSSVNSTGSSDSKPGGVRRKQRLKRSLRIATGRELDHTLAAYCGVSIGRVHCGFAGSTHHRVEIADGPAVRRASALAAYSRRFNMQEVVVDAAVGRAAKEAGRVAWTADLVSLVSGKETTPGEDAGRERVMCVGPPSGPSLILPHEAQRLEAAWAAVFAADEGGAAVQYAKDCVAQLAVYSSHRAVHALAHAAASPATYCFKLDGTSM